LNILKSNNQNKISNTKNINDKNIFKIWF